MDYSDSDDVVATLATPSSTVDLVVAEWNNIVQSVPDRTRKVVSDLVQRSASELSSRFYQTMMSDPRASAYLDHDTVATRLNHAMQDWLTNLFEEDGRRSVTKVIEQQRRVGHSHARIKIPINLVGKGARHLKHWIWTYLSSCTQLSPDELTIAIVYVNDILDLALEIMNASFVSNNDRSARADEGYRLFSLSHDLAIERERQRAALVEWIQQVMSSVYRQPGTPVALIGQSEFGLWLVHKAQFVFEHSPEVKQIKAIVERIDSQIITRMVDLRDMERISAAFAQLDGEVSEIRYLLSTLFDRYLEIENGRDVLTKLLNRRFLPSVMRREIDLAQQTSHMFAVLLIDIDLFKHVNDNFGHDAGDAALQQTAILLMNSIRSSDFIFRLGGEEILIILVDVDPKSAKTIAENIRSKVEQNTIHLSGNNSVKVTISIGIAMYDGHPDYKRIMNRADAAVYAAKKDGRNRCMLAE